MPSEGQKRAEQTRITKRPEGRRQVAKKQSSADPRVVRNPAITQRSARLQSYESREFSNTALPPPTMLQAYEDIKPGYADRIMDAFERQEAHRQYLERITRLRAMAVVYGRASCARWLLPWSFWGEASSLRSPDTIPAEQYSPVSSASAVWWAWSVFSCTGPTAGARNARESLNKSRKIGSSSDRGMLHVNLRGVRTPDQNRSARRHKQGGPARPRSREPSSPAPLPRTERGRG